MLPHGMLEMCNLKDTTVRDKAKSFKLSLALADKQLQTAGKLGRRLLP
jgi:hypothetical protein